MHCRYLKSPTTTRRLILPHFRLEQGTLRLPLLTKMSTDASQVAAWGKLPPHVLEGVPAMLPPPGQVSNFDGPRNFVKTAVIVVTISSFLMIVAVGLRVYSKITSARPFLWDDCTYHLFSTQTKGTHADTAPRYDFACIGKSYKALLSQLIGQLTLLL